MPEYGPLSKGQLESLARLLTELSKLIYDAKRLAAFDIKRLNRLHGISESLRTEQLIVDMELSKQPSLPTGNE
jgi:hypothetical protein